MRYSDLMGIIVPTLRSGSAQLVPLPTAAEMQAWDRRATREIGIAERVLIEGAGRAAAAVVQNRYPEGRLVAVIGGGHNGADAAVMIRTLAVWGRSVVAISANNGLDVGEYWHGWEIPQMGPEDAQRAFGGAAAIIDGLLGTGASGAPRDGYAALIGQMNRSNAPVIALDGPSGVDLTDGSVAGEAVRAELTIAFGAMKRGLCMFPGRAYAGRIVVVEVGFPPPDSRTSDAALITPSWAHRHLPKVPLDAHKGRLGTVAVVAGHPGMGGAALMVGMGALRAGAGAVRVVSPSENRVPIQTVLPEALFVDRDGPAVREVAADANALVVGPGMGLDEGALEILRVVLDARTAPIVLDADALTMIARDPEILPTTDREHILLTPHPGEMSRLLSAPVEEITADPFHAATEAAKRFGCSVILKGAPSIVAAPGEQTLVNLSGHSGIATGGMGDTLAGVCGAFLAAGATPRETAALALYFSGRAAEIAGRGRALLPRDVAEALPEAMRDESTEMALPMDTGVLVAVPPAR